MKKLLTGLALLLCCALSMAQSFNPNLPYAQINNACGQIFYQQNGNIFGFNGNYNYFPSGLPTCVQPQTQFPNGINTGSSPITTSNIQVTGGTISTTNITNDIISGGTITGTTGVTQNGLDNSTQLATDQFTQAAIQYTMATKPLNLGATGGGTYSFASVGTGAIIVWNSSGGALTSSLTIATPGTGYAVGDLIRPTGGNNDATARVQSVSGGGITGVLVLYGGTGYPGPVTGNQANADSSTYPYTFTITGTLTSNAVIIVTPGSLITQSNQWLFNNNTTGVGFTMLVQVSGQSGGISTNTPIGTGIFIPQGTNSSSATNLQSDGVTDVWRMAPSVGGFDHYYNTVTPTTGQTVTLVPSNQTTLILPAGTLATLTITLPACGPGIDAKLQRYSSSQIISALTVNATAGSVVGAPVSLSVGQGNQYLCDGAATTWYRMY